MLRAVFVGIAAAAAILGPWVLREPHSASIRPARPDLTVRVPRRGWEWDALEPLVRTLRPEDGITDLQVAVAEDASYEDLVRVLLVAEAASLSPRVVEPLLATHPFLDTRGGLRG